MFVLERTKPGNFAKLMSRFPLISLASITGTLARVACRISRLPPTCALSALKPARIEPSISMLPLISALTSHTLPFRTVVPRKSKLLATRTPSRLTITSSEVEAFSGSNSAPAKTKFPLTSAFGNRTGPPRTVVRLKNNLLTWRLSPTKAPSKEEPLRLMSPSTRAAVNSSGPPRTTAPSRRNKSLLTCILKSDEFSSAFLMPFSFEGGRRPTVL